jgi:hypothetical protein
MGTLKKVVCIKYPVISYMLTHNKIYDVILEAPSVTRGAFKYLITSDDGNKYWFNVKEFKDLDEVRNEKIEKILS